MAAAGLPDTRMRRKNSSRRPTAFVTGASQGIGAGIAAALARAGHDVAVSSTQPEKLSGVLKEITAAGARALPVELQIRSQASVERALSSVVAEFGRLDVLVNNAGIALRKAALDITPTEWDAIIGANLTGTFFMCQQMGRHLIGGKRPGCILNMASTHGVVAMAKRSAYGIAKAGIIHMTKMLAIEWAEHGIRVNAVAPGAVVTPGRLAMPADEGHAATRMARIPLQKLCTVDDVAGAFTYLASPQAAYITGQTLILDGGVTAQ
jgi:NAD(P)-dependent dehydrogenase (short-subunit alcohol dehydrogenase family)